MRIFKDGERSKRHKGNAGHFLTFCLLAYDSHVLKMFR